MNGTRQRPLAGPARHFVAVPFYLVLTGLSACPTDDDGDGYTSNVDCNDSDPSVYPDAPELCNSTDDDCDGELDEGAGTTFYPDVDRDFYGVPGATVVACEVPGGYAPYADDCDDSDPAVHPDADDRCDGLDNDCDQRIDEDLQPAWRDADGDGFGATGQAFSSPCVVPAGYVLARGDCNDAQKGVHPGAADGVGDGIDQDCGGVDGQQPSVGLAASSHTTLQAALDAAIPGQTVWVGPGLYAEYDVSFEGKGVTLSSTHGAEATVIKGGEAWGSVVRFSTGEGPAAVLDGFSVTGGRTDKGGGIFVSGASPTVRDCVIYGNGFTEGFLAEATYQAYGGGIYMENGSPQLERCTIRDNMAGDPDYGFFTALVEGGGIYMYRSSPLLRDCRISGNVADSIGPTDAQGDHGNAWGGGISAYVSNLTLVGCRISANRALVDFKYGYMDGGGLRVRSGEVRMDNCVVERNAGMAGGGMLIESADATIQNSLFQRNYGRYGGGLSGRSDDDGEGINLTNVVIRENTATNHGGGVSFIPPRFRIANSAIIGNTSPDAGGIKVVYPAEYYDWAVITNSIVAYNEGYNIHIDPASITAPEVIWSDVYNVSGELNHNFSTLGMGSTTQEPKFLSYDEENHPMNLHLSLVSAIIDAGDLSQDDPDESQSDMGAYGGPQGDNFDLDRDGFPDWFWPGTIYDAPANFSADAYDRNDMDPSVH